MNEGLRPLFIRMETLSLTNPIVPPTVSGFQVILLTLDWESKFITIGLKGTNGERLTHHYTGDTAHQFMVLLNKANLSTTSLHKRILQRLNTDGILVGSVTGSPD